MIEQDQGQVIANMKKNTVEEILFTLREYKGHRLVDIRVYTDAEDYQGPTKKGICLRIEQLPEFMGCLEKVQRALKEGQN